MKDERVVISGSIDVDDERSRIAGEGRQLAKFAATLLVLEGLASHAGSEERRWHGSLASARSSVATAFMFGVLCTGSGVYALANDLWYGWIGLSVALWMSLMLYGSLGLLGHAKQMIDVWTLTREKAELTLFEYTINIPEM